MRHNLWGVDIDARCAQIAALALWMRAQRAYQEADVARGARLQINRSNIVVAEPMPGEPALRAEFLASIPDRKLRTLVERVFTHLELAGEAGTLLKIEEEIDQDIRKVYGLKRVHGQMFAEEDEENWERIEWQLLDALQFYGSQTQDTDHYRRRLFAEDAAAGFAFVDLCRQRYDVAVMNPPFGSASWNTKQLVEEAYPKGRFDIAAAFIERALTQLTSGGKCGAIINRTIWFGSRLEPFRRNLIQSHSLDFGVDLGLGVLDAFVETVMNVISKGSEGASRSLWLDWTSDQDRTLSSVHLDQNVLTQTSSFDWTTSAFLSLTGSPFSYWVPPDLAIKMNDWTSISEAGLDTKQGLATTDNERFLRARWEVPSGEIYRRWYTYAKGGQYAPLLGDFHLVIDWSASARAAYDNRTGQFCCLISGQSHRYVFRPGITYSTRTSRFSARIFPAMSLFDTKGSVVFDNAVTKHSDNVDRLLELVAFMNTDLAQYILDLRGGATDEGKARDYSQGKISGLPYSSPAARSEIVALVREFVSRGSELASIIPERAEYLGMIWSEDLLADLEMVRRYSTSVEEILANLLKFTNREYGISLGVTEESLSKISAVVTQDHRNAVHELLAIWSPESYAEMVLESLLGYSFGVHDVGRVRHELSQDPTVPDSLFGRLPAEQPGVAVAEGIRAVLVDDYGHPLDIATQMNGVLSSSRGDSKSAFLQATDCLGIEPGTWVQRLGFQSHVSRRTKSGRSAPVYWQIATPSAKYSVWLYIHRATPDTLYAVLNEFATPKLQVEERRLSGLILEAGPAPSAGSRRDIAEQEGFVGELQAFRQEVARVAPLWAPDLNDGVTINFAPLWRLVPQHRAWQKEVKTCWDALCAGTYDWSHLSMRLWPERVVPKCADDRSLAIAHNLEAVFWVEGDSGKWRKREIGAGTVERLVVERTSPAVKAALADLLSAPAVAAVVAAGRAGGHGANAAR